MVEFTTQSENVLKKKIPALTWSARAGVPPSNRMSDQTGGGVCGAPRDFISVSKLPRNYEPFSSYGQ